MIHVTSYGPSENWDRQPLELDFESERAALDYVRALTQFEWTSSSEIASDSNGVTTVIGPNGHMVGIYGGNLTHSNISFYLGLT